MRCRAGALAHDVNDVHVKPARDCVRSFIARAASELRIRARVEQIQAKIKSAEQQVLQSNRLIL